MRMLKFWCCLFLLITGFGLMAQSADNSVRVRASLGSSAIQLGDPARLTVTISAPARTQLGQTNHEVLNQSEGLELIEQIRIIFDNYDLETQILAASVRHNSHLLNAALAGSDVATVPFKVLAGMIKHPLTDSGLEKFLADHKKSTEAAAQR